MSDPVHSPAHYNRGGVELADVIDAFGLGRWEAQAAQYLFRARLKAGGAHEAQDLEKAIWFIRRRLARLAANRAAAAAPRPRGAPLEPGAAHGLSQETARKAVTLDETLAAVTGRERMRLADQPAVALAVARREADLPPVFPATDTMLDEALAGLDRDLVIVRMLDQAAHRVALGKVAHAPTARAAAEAPAPKRLVPRTDPAPLTAFAAALDADEVRP